MKRSHNFVLAVLLSLLAAGCGELPTDPVQHQVPQGSLQPSISRGDGSYSFGGYTYSCSGEPIAFTGQADWHWQLMNHSSGDLLMNNHMRTRMDGTGVFSGAKYVANGTDNFVALLSAPQPGLYTYTESYHFVGITQGPADDIAFRVVAKWTIDATGKLAVEKFHVESVCRG